jgi:hypothetical protein
MMPNSAVLANTAIELTAQLIASVRRLSMIKEAQNA